MFASKARPYLSEAPFNDPLWGRLLALPMNIERQGWKSLEEVLLSPIMFERRNYKDIDYFGNTNLKFRGHIFSHVRPSKE
jgi:hypothetical protein